MLLLSNIFCSCNACTSCKSLTSLAFCGSGISLSCICLSFSAFVLRRSANCFCCSCAISSVCSASFLRNCSGSSLDKISNCNFICSALPCVPKLFSSSAICFCSFAICSFRFASSISVFTLNFASIAPSTDVNNLSSSGVSAFFSFSSLRRFLMRSFAASASNLFCLIIRSLPFSVPLFCICSVSFASFVSSSCKSFAVFICRFLIRSCSLAASSAAFLASFCASFTALASYGAGAVDIFFFGVNSFSICALATLRAAMRPFISALSLASNLPPSCCSSNSISLFIRANSFCNSIRAFAPAIWVRLKTLRNFSPAAFTCFSASVKVVPNKVVPSALFRSTKDAFNFVNSKLDNSPRPCLILS